MRWLAAASLVLVVAAGLAAAVVAHRLSALAEEAPEVLFVVERGASLASVARSLEEADLVRDARAVVWLARLRGLSAKLRAGEYRLSAALTPGEMLAHISEGHVITYEVSFPEGFTARQIGERLEARDLVEADAFAAAVRDAALAARLEIPASNLEGYLYPETYRLPRGLSAHEVASIMVEHFKRAWREIEDRAGDRSLDMHGLVTLASIVEKETGVSDERPLIASVFANRLARGMRLESDPTVIYGIPEFDGNLRRSDLDDRENPYNTYQIRGLPPGPIANPGIDSLRAALNPADTDYLYFVSRNDGTHVFSRTYRDHVNAVNQYQRRRRSK